jgi:DNA-binding NtrC family response regulator
VKKTRKQPGEFGKPWEVRQHPWGAEWWVVTHGWKPGDESAGQKVCSTHDLAVAVKIASNHNASLPSEPGRPTIPLTRDVIWGAMSRAGMKLGEAAAILGIHRNTLRAKIQELGAQKPAINVQTAAEEPQK